MTDVKQVQNSQSEEVTTRSRLLSLILKGVLAIVVSVLLFLMGAFIYLGFKPLEVSAEESVATIQSQIQPQGNVKIRYLGVTGFEITDGKTTVICDPAMNRPMGYELISGRLNPDPTIPQKWVPEADFILVNHAHYDHSIDMPEIAKRTGAVVVGTTSVCNLARSRGIPESQIREVNGSQELQIGTFKLICRPALHGKVLKQKDPMWGKIPTDAKKLWFFQYTMDGSLTFWLKSGNTTVMHHPSAKHKPGQIEGLQADTLIMGINGEPSSYAEARAIMEIVKPKVIVPCHFDNFFQPISAGLSIFPGLDVKAAQKKFLTVSDAKWVMMDYNEVLKLPTRAR